MEKAPKTPIKTMQSHFISIICKGILFTMTTSSLTPSQKLCVPNMLSSFQYFGNLSFNLQLLFQKKGIVEENTKQSKTILHLEMCLFCSTWKRRNTTNFWQCAILATPFALRYLTGNQTRRYLLLLKDNDIPFSLLGNNLMYTATNQYNNHLNMRLTPLCVYQPFMGLFFFSMYKGLITPDSVHGIDQRRQMSDLTGKYEAFMTHN